MVKTFWIFYKLNSPYLISKAYFILPQIMEACFFLTIKDYGLKKDIELRVYFFYKEFRRIQNISNYLPKIKAKKDLEVY